MHKNFSLTLFQSVGTILKGFLLVVLLGGIAAMMIGGFIIFKTIETAPELDISKIYATESSYIYDKMEMLLMNLVFKNVSG